MRILVIAPQPFFTPRGTPFSVYYRLLALAEQGVEADLLTYGEGADVDLPGLRIIRIPRLRFLGPVPIGPSWQKLLLDVLMMLWTTVLLLRSNYQSVHVHEEAALWCRLLKPLLRFRMVYEVHSDLAQQMDNFNVTGARFLAAVTGWFQRGAMRAADAVVTVCPALRDHVLAVGVPPERHVLIENSLFDDVRIRAPARPEPEPAPAPPAFGPGEPVIAYAGTFEVYQGIPLLVEAFARVLDRRPDARLLMVGGRPDQVGAIRALADRLGLGDRCQLTGQVSKAAAQRYLAAAQVVVSPRLTGTNTPLKIYENLASGKPLVATRIESHTQVLDDSVCCLVEPNAGALANGLLAALNDSAGADARAERARARYDRDYSRTAYASKVRQLLQIVH